MYVLYRWVIVSDFCSRIIELVVLLPIMVQYFLVHKSYSIINLIQTVVLFILPFSSLIKHDTVMNIYNINE